MNASPKDELRRVFLSASKQARVAGALVAHGGLKLETIGNYRADDNLRIRGLPEPELKAGEISFEKNPAMILSFAPV